MPDANPLVEHVIDLLSDWGAVEAKPMFGGWGLYRQRSVFGMIAADALYLKVDDVNREHFAASGGRPFEYPSHTGKLVMMSYWSPPDAAMDDSEELAAWAQSGFEAARRAQASRQPRRTAAPRRGAVAASKPASGAKFHPARARTGTVAPARTRTAAAKPARPASPGRKAKSAAVPAARSTAGLTTRSTAGLTAKSTEKRAAKSQPKSRTAKAKHPPAIATGTRRNRGAGARARQPIRSSPPPRPPSRSSRPPRH